MTTRHTPGPYAFKDGMVYSEATGKTLAMLPYHGDEPEQIATGTLLAAASDLLEALKTLREWVRYPYPDDGALNEAVIYQAEQAIIKAEEG